MKLDIFFPNAKSRMPNAFFLLIPILCLLTGCGFTPVYGTHGGEDSPVATQLSQIAIDNIPDRKGQILRNELIDRMYGKSGRPQQPVYRLVVKLRVVEEDLGIQANATSTRSLLNMYGDYELQDMKGKAILHGVAHSISGFDTLVDEYGNLAAYNSAIERTVSECGEQIVNRLSLYFAEKDEGNTLTNSTTVIAPQDPSPVGSPSFVSPTH